MLASMQFQTAHAQTSDKFTPEDVHIAMSRVGPITQCVVTSEIGGVGYNPYAHSRTNDNGPIQIHGGPGDFIYDDYMNITPIIAEQLGWPDPKPDIYDPYKTIPYLQWMLLHGYGSHWRAIQIGMC